PGAARYRAEGDATDGRPTIPPVPGVENGCLAPRGEGAADGRGEEEPGLVEEHEVWPAAERLPDDPGEIVTDPPRHLLVVTFPGLRHRLLVSPPEPPLQDLANVLGVVAGVEVPLDQPGHPGGGPQLVVPPVGLGPLRQQALQSPKVGVGQAGGGC